MMNECQMMKSQSESMEMGSVMTLLRPLDAACGKSISYIDGTPRLDDDIEAEKASMEGRVAVKRRHPKFYSAREAVYSDLETFVAVASAVKKEFMVNERLAPGVDPRRLRRTSANFETTKHRLVPIDIDNTGTDEPDGAVLAKLTRGRLPEAFHDVRCAWNLTASHTIGRSGKSKIRLYFFADRPVDNRELQAWLAPFSEIADPAIYHDRQANYLAPGPIKGGPDPFEGKRWGLIDGERETVVVPTDIEPRKRSAQRQWIAPIDVKVNDPEMIELAIPRLLQKRTSERIENDKRRNTFRMVGYDLKDRAISHPLATAVVLAWFWHDESTEDLREVLAECGVKDAASIAEAVRAHGAALEDVFAQGDAIGDAEICKQIDDAYASKNRPFGCITVEMERAETQLSDSKEFEVVTEEEEAGQGARAAFEDWRESGDSTGLISELAGTDAVKHRAIELASARAWTSEFFGEGDIHGDLAFIEKHIAAAESSASKKSTKVNRFAPISIEEAVAYSQKHPSPYLIKNLFYEGGISLLFAPSNVGKTFVEIDLAFHVAAGIKWGKHRVRQGAVLYIAAEGGKITYKRLDALSRKHKIKGVQFYIVTTAPDLARETKDRDALVRLVREYEATRGITFKLIVIDTLAMTMGGADENSNEGMGAVIDSVKHIVEKTGAHVSIVHHAGKDTTKGARGWSGLKAAVDAELEIRDGVLRVTKMRDGEKGGEYGFHLEPVVLGEDSDGDERFSCVVNWSQKVRAGLAPPSPAEKAYIEALQTAQAKTGRLSVVDKDVEEGFNAARVAAGENPAKRSNINRARDGLIKKGYVATDEYGCVLMLIEPATGQEFEAVLEHEDV
jgi:hypothetical protein